jgi:succinoglycan biosynthesis transport protein ExoP
MSTSSLLIPTRQAPTTPALAGVNSMPAANLELRHVILVLRRRKGIILTALALGIVIALCLAMTAQKKFSATATIEVNKENGSALGLDDLSGTTSESDTADQVNTDLLTHQAVIESDNTALNVIKALRLDTLPPYSSTSNSHLAAEDRGDDSPAQRDKMLSIFHSGLSVKLVKGTRLIDVTYTDSDPHRSAAVANAIIDSFIDQYTEARYQASAKASTWLANQLTDLKNKVTESQAKVEQYQKESGLAGMTMSAQGGPAGQTATVTSSSNNVPLERLVELNRDLTSADVSRISKEAIYKMTETQDPDVVLGIGSSPLANEAGADSVLSSGSTDLALLQQLRQQQAQLKVQLAAAETKYGAKNPVIEQLQTEVAAQNDQIHAELTRIRARARNDLDVATLAENSIRGRIAGQEDEVNKVSAKADQLLLLQQEALSSRQLYQDLYTKLEEASVAAGIKASNITLVNPARVPSHPSAPKRLMMVELGAVAGFFLGLFAAFGVDYFDDSITSPQDLEEITTIPAIALIPQFPKRLKLVSRQRSLSLTRPAADAGSDTWLIRDPASQVAEAYRTLRTALMMSRAEHPPKVISIVSGLAQEGKSTTCFNTAAAFAIQGSRVLYLDADLRRPAASRSFECAQDPGLTNYLTSTRPIAEVIHQSSEIDTLFITPAGTVAPNPSELIGSRRFTGMMNELRSQFDYVFIDTPPLLFVSDGQLLSSFSDGYLLVLKSGHATKSVLRRTLTAMSGWKTSPLGIVLNGVNTRSAEYSMYGYSAAERSYYAAKAS